MRYIAKKTYVLAIHGCPVWPVIGTAEQLSDIFVNFAADGGRFAECLNAVPEIHQTLDATGGFGRLDDASFEIIDTPDADFARFFVSRLQDSALPVKIVGDIWSTDSQLQVESTNGLSVGNDIYLPRETVRVTSVVDDHTIDVARSRYSAFREGVFPEIENLITQPDGSFVRMLAGLEYGHWEHLNRWVALYEIEKGPTEELTDPYPVKRLYAGTIREVSFGGSKINIGTTSIMNVIGKEPLQRPFCGFDPDYPYTIAGGTYYFTIRGLYTVDDDELMYNHVFVYLPFSTSMTLRDYIITELNATLADPPGHIASYRFQYGQLQIALTAFHQDDVRMPKKNITNKSLVKMFRLTDIKQYLYTIYPLSIFTTSGEPLDKNPPYDTVICQGFKFRLNKTNVIVGNDAYIRFDSGYGDVASCRCFQDASDPSVWMVSTNPADKWYDGEGNELVGSPQVSESDQWLCVERDTCKISQEYAGLAEDLLEIVRSEMLSRYRIPDVLLAPYLPSPNPPDPTWFHYINYPVSPLKADETLTKKYESSLKIAGHRVIWSSATGRIISKRDRIPILTYVQNEYLHSEILQEKPSLAVGYQAPASKITVSFAKNDVSVNSVTGESGQKVEIKDEIFMGDDDLALEKSTKAVELASWLGTVLPSIQESVFEIKNEVGDIVSITNKYVAGSAGYGVQKIPGMITEIVDGASKNIRVLMSSNLFSDLYCQLAPSGLINTAIGDSGYDSGERTFSLVSNAFGMGFCAFLVDVFERTGLFNLQLRSCNSSGAVETIGLKDCTVIPSTEKIHYAYGFEWPVDFGTDGYIWVTIGDYWMV